MKQIPLTRGLFAIVDDEDFEALNKYRWFAKSDRGLFYAARNVYRRTGQGRIGETVRMHRQIMGLAPSDRVLCDHRNGNGLDNRRSNLRAATPSQNAQNRTSSPNQKKGGFKGVSFDKKSGKWRVQHREFGASGTRSRVVQVGIFDTPIEAARAYDRAALAFYGEFASLNFPEHAEADG